MSRKLTYGDFTRTGWQDCGNVFDMSEHHEAWLRLGKPRGADAAKKVVQEAWGDDDEARESWLDQADVDEIVEDDLDPRQAYTAWRDAWQDCATSAVKAELKTWIDNEHQRSDKSTRKQALQPVEGLLIPADSRRELNRFWRAHPALRKGCLHKYGFDPIDEEADYWRFGMAEPDHQSLLRAIRRNNDVFSLDLVKRWEAQELKHAKIEKR